MFICIHSSWREYYRSRLWLVEPKVLIVAKCGCEERDGAGNAEKVTILGKVSKIQGLMND